MSTKSDVLKILEQNSGKTISGEELASMLAISRTSVWKAIKSLREQGYIINAITNNGYCLNGSTDVLSAEGIMPYLSEENKDINIIVHRLIDSTNHEAKRLAIDNASHGTTVIAIEQTNGRGRLGREFFSPCDSGVYMSIILRLDVNISDAILITTAASVAVCHAIEKVAPHIKPQIKWVNDIYIGDKKVCGILTEAVTNFESGTIEGIVIGIGVNFTTAQNQFPKEIRESAASLFDSETTAKKNCLAAAIIDEILQQAQSITNREFLKEYIERSYVIGKAIDVITPTEKYKAKAIDIDKNGGLVVKCEDGSLKTLNSGEISIRTG